MLKWFSTPLAPDQVLQRLRECVRDQEAEQSTSKTESATAPTETGARPVGESTLIGQVEGNRFRIRRAVKTPPVWWYLTPGPLFQPYLEGRVTLAQSGSRLETRGAAPLLGVFGWLLTFLGVAGLGIIITVLSYPADISHDPADAASNFASGLAVTGTICALLFLIPVVGWLMTRNHLPDIIRELKKRLELLEEPVVYSISSHPSPSPRAVGLPKE